MKKFFLMSLVATAIAPCYAAHDNLHRYMWANYNQFAGKQEIASRWYKEILNADASLYAYKGYAHLLFDAGQYKAMLPLLPKLEPLFAKDPILGLIFAQALDQTGHPQAADERIIALNDKCKNNQEIAYQTVGTYMRRKEPENALRIIDNFLNGSPRKPTHFVFYFLKSQIYAKLNNLPEALTNIQKSLEMQPYFDRGWLMLALLQENAGRIQEAIKGYTTFLEIAGPHGEVEGHLMQLLFKQKMAQKQISSLVANKNYFALALQLFEKKEFAAALANVDLCLQAESDNAEAKLLKVQILTALNKHADTLAALQKWILHDPHPTQWLQVLSLLPKAGANYGAVIATLKNIEQKLPKNSQVILYLADAQVRGKDFTGALSTLRKALTMVDNNNIKTKIYFQMGMIYYHEQNFKAMHDVLAQGKQLHADFPPLLNLLAYYYATKGNNLIEAQKLMKIVLGYDATNPHFLDTQAIIFYKQKKYTKALKLLEKVASAAPHDFTIQKHLGKTYNKLGKKQEASQSFKKAMTLAVNDRDKQNGEKLLKKFGI
jgi:tetratricopeptide (TPR) repeat protein